MVGYVYVDIDPSKVDIGSYVEKAKLISLKRYRFHKAMLCPGVDNLKIWKELKKAEDCYSTHPPSDYFLTAFQYKVLGENWNCFGRSILAHGAVWFLVFLGYNLPLLHGLE